ncbi:hypothetical protein SAMN02910413_0867 [Pseudobutyrivibrio sp. C4]|uniref:hypothetical protein n=1 Tax=Pseudobutyrivibrio sp. C4 TaxID=1520803 RepID=UPI0008C1DBBC|nr:hypothetical protein [Pseudobutyrivibrio sp. C4]SES77966.1 hypothetical protein SAMN02910413_0867 [Pseudobutyrivibrio sp. C4]
MNLALNEIFENKEYKSLFYENKQFDLSIFKNKDNTLLAGLHDIYISKHGDELFVIVYNENNKSIIDICEEWDRRLSMFFNFGSNNRESLYKFKYNAILIVLDKYETSIEEYSVQSSMDTMLNVTRKIYLNYINEDGKIQIDEKEALKLPFYNKKYRGGNENNVLLEHLKALMPNPEKMSFLYDENNTKRGQRKFGDEQHKLIMEWLEDED